MLDFLKIMVRNPKKGVDEVVPIFVVKKRTKDLMVRGGDFYAVWDEREKKWSTDEDVLTDMIDDELRKFAEERRKSSDNNVVVKYLWDSEAGSIDRWHKFVQKQMRDNFHNLDESLVFANTEPKRENYSSKSLPYNLADGDISAYDELMSVLYSPSERHKIEWAIGSIVNGDSKRVQKFLVMYGSAGTGKSTVLNIIQELFEGYWTSFDAKALGSANSTYALEPFKNNPLVAIQHDGDLSRIEDNTRLNSMVSHETMTVNAKYEKLYSSRFNCFLFMGTNRPVRITDAKSGVIRRLIDVSPTGNKVPPKRYKQLMDQIKFELGAIAMHCKRVYEEDPEYYNNYIPVNMLQASNDFYNFVMDSYEVFKRENGVSLKAAYEMYKTYCTDSNVAYPYPKRQFKEELKNYFVSFTERARGDGDTKIYNYYEGFLADKFLYSKEKQEEDVEPSLKFTKRKSIFDKEYADYPAQLASEKETPQFKWENVTTTLKDIDTSLLHYVRVPKEHIVIDFDLKDESGNKSFEKNLEAASKWPKTYAELSKSGAGIHLHYIYTGDVSKLSSKYADGIEVKVFSGKSSLRRKLTKCNGEKIATLNSGLPLKGDKKMVNFDSVKSEKGLRTLIERNLRKEIHPATAPSVDFINKILEDAYNNGLKYDVTDMRPTISEFASRSSHQAERCLKVVSGMKFKSDEPSRASSNDEAPIIFYDVEVFPNLFVIVWKAEGKEPVKMINPTPAQVEELMQFRLVGFNCRRYDNHILYARLMGYNNMQLYNQSQRIINGSKNAFFGEAYNISYADIYDFSSKKQSLKKFEIDLGIHHQELGLPWDQPVDEDKWLLVADYCVNDVVATEAVWKARQEDFNARKILASISGLSVNDTTRLHTTRIIFGDDKHPPLVYTDLSEIFPGYVFDASKSKDERSLYKGEYTGEGGFVYSEPGMYGNVALLDIASMHPTSIIQLNLFGPYTVKFKEIVESRLAIKHRDLEKAKTLLGGALVPYLGSDEEMDALAAALKIVINSVYGYTTATFDNPFKDTRNVDNIVAKRGALFMIDLKEAVQKKGFTVAHIKTDSIKIPDATPEIIQFVIDFGKKYGYNFEHEATYEKMCLVNDAVYIAKYKDGKKAGQWTATGTQFQVPYVFKTLFSHEPIEFDDMCETKSVSTALYLDMNEDLPEDEHRYQFIGKVGRFCPIKPGCGGGLLLREKSDGGYGAATGSKGYRWLESEIVRHMKKEKDIDENYYISLADDAKAAISEYGDFEWFASNDPYVMNLPN